MARVAFFGLTSYGPQNQFRANQIDFSMIGAFNEAEFEAAFKSVEFETDGPGVNLDQFEAVLAIVYHGPPPRGDLARLKKHFFVLEGATTFTLDDFLQCTRAAAADEEVWAAEQRDKVADPAEFHTSAEYHTSMSRHTRMDKDPIDKFLDPVTASMMHGWVKGNPNGPRCAKKSCEETVFASELIKAGVYY